MSVLPCACFLTPTSPGKVATIGPKQMLLILPFGAHGVFSHGPPRHLVDAPYRIFAMDNR
jgi:hypothetical protein